MQGSWPPMLTPIVLRRRLLNSLQPKRLRPLILRSGIFLLNITGSRSLRAAANWRERRPISTLSSLFRIRNRRSVKQWRLTGSMPTALIILYIHISEDVRTPSRTTMPMPSGRVVGQTMRQITRTRTRSRILAETDRSESISTWLLTAKTTWRTMARRIR